MHEEGMTTFKLINMMINAHLEIGRKTGYFNFLAHYYDHMNMNTVKFCVELLAIQCN